MKNGIKSGSTRRELRQAIKALLSMPVKGKHLEFLKGLGVDEKDADNNMLVAAFLFVRVLRGDDDAFRLLMEYGGLSPSEKRLDKKTNAEIELLKARAAACSFVPIVGGDGGERDDVFIYSPDNGRGASVEY